jgi:sulfur carrier protein ThiS
MMNTTVLVKVGQIPGAVNEYALEVGSTVAQALELATLTEAGFEIRMDGVVVTPATVIPTEAKMILLVKQIKGNCETVLVKIGQIPGAVNEFAVEEGTSISEALVLAGLNPSGFEVRMDGTVVQGDDLIEEDTKMILLVKQIKGNSPMVKIGQIPGAVNEYALETGTTIAQALELANLSATGFEVRMDGVVVESTVVIPEDAKMVLLVKQIKGN